MIELDERIPFIPKLVQHCNNQMSADDIKFAEIQIFETCDWNPLYPTVLEMVEHTLSQGIFYASDKLSIPEKYRKSTTQENTALKPTPGVLCEQKNNAKSQFAKERPIQSLNQQQDNVSGQENKTELDAQNGETAEGVKKEGLSSKKSEEGLAEPVSANKEDEFILVGDLEESVLSEFLYNAEIEATALSNLIL